MTDADEALQNLARRATEALLQQTPITVIHESWWVRDGFPLPIKRNKTPNADGTTAQEYRPLAILEYVDDVLSGAIKARQQRQRAAQKKEKESSDDRC